MKKKVIVSLSGGLDSAVVLAQALCENYEVEAVGFCYGSKHNKFENKAAQSLANYMNVPFRLIDMRETFKNFQSSLMADSNVKIPEGHYEAESMKSTVVPSRNIIFLSILSGLAWSVGAEEVWIGIHAGDHFIYPDCRPKFFEVMRRAIEIGTDERITLVAPFLHVAKRYIVQRGIELGVPFELTRTCYKNQETACGKCGSCIERLRAFELNNAEDPICYTSD